MDPPVTKMSCLAKVALEGLWSSEPQWYRNCNGRLLLETRGACSEGWMERWRARRRRFGNPQGQQVKFTRLDSRPVSGFNSELWAQEQRRVFPATHARGWKKKKSWFGQVQVQAGSGSTTRLFFFSSLSPWVRAPYEERGGEKKNERHQQRKERKKIIGSGTTASTGNG